MAGPGERRVPERSCLRLRRLFRRRGLCWWRWQCSSRGRLLLLQLPSFLLRLLLQLHQPKAFDALRPQVPCPPVLEVGLLLLRCCARPDGRRTDKLVDDAGPLVDLLRLRGLGLRRRWHDAIAGGRQRNGLSESLLIRRLLVGPAPRFLLAVAENSCQRRLVGGLILLVLVADDRRGGGGHPGCTSCTPRRRCSSCSTANQSSQLGESAAYAGFRRCSVVSRGRRRLTSSACTRADRGTADTGILSRSRCQPCGRVTSE
ncbi:hypothetical protein D1007_25530 [Hordeum vulgare]|nr:hypothetical protein D1007_25530 [Hordeum vulgare]